MPGSARALTSAFIFASRSLSDRLLLNDAEVACRTTKRGNHLIELRSGVRSIHLGTNSRFSMGHNRKGERDDVNTLLLHALGETHGEGRIPEHHRDDRMLAWDEIESQGLDRKST